jgi:TRAP-type C4-dicarboxylate transport system permease small subunit
MDKLYKCISKISLWGAYLASVLLVTLVMLIMTEIISRHYFNTSTMIADEYSGYLYLASIFLGLAYTFENNAHIRINIITSKLSKKLNKYIDFFASIITSVVLIFIFYRTILFAFDSYSMEMLSENVSETPLYLTQIVMPFGIAIFILTVFIFTIKRIRDDI